VSGNSMAPLFEAGDRLLVAPALRIRAGQVVALRDPRDGRLIIKRVAAVIGGAVEVTGDNRGSSTDSRHFGPVPKREILGTVVYRYAPAGRVGRRPR
jgi:mitochondrial inner membrane protease subunit 1